MATETPTSHQTPTSDHESIEIKVNEEVKPAEPESVSLAKKTEEEDEKLKSDELPCQSIPEDKSGEAAEVKEVEPSAVEVKKIDDVPVIDVPVDEKIESEKESTPDLHTHSVPAPVADIVNGEPVAQVATESVPKEAEEQLKLTSEEESQLEQPKAVDIPEEADEKPQESSEVLTIKELEPIEAKDSVDLAVIKEVDKLESVIPEAEVKPEEKSEVDKQVEEQETDVAIDKPQEPLEVLPIKSEAVVVKDDEASEAVTKKDDGPESETAIPEVEVKPEEQSEVIEQGEPEEKSVEAIAETQEPEKVIPIKETEDVQVKDIDGSQELSKEAEKIEPVVVEPSELVTEETEAVKKEDDGPESESVVPEFEVKPEEQSKVIKQGEPEDESVEETAETQEPAEAIAIKESEDVQVKDIDVLQELSKEAEKVEPEVTEDSEAVTKVEDALESESVVSEVEVKQEEQSQVTKQGEPEQKAGEANAETQEPAETVAIKESESAQVKDIDDSQELSQQAEKVEPVAADPREQKEPEVGENIEKQEDHSVEVIGKKMESTEVLPIKESEVASRGVDASPVAPKVDKPESVVPEAEVKQEEQSEFTEQIEKQESIAPEVEVKVEEQSEAKQDEKPEGESESTEVLPIKESEVVTRGIDDSSMAPKVIKSESVVPEVEVKQEKQSEASEQIEKQEPIAPEVEVEEQSEAKQNEKPEGESEVGELVEIKPTDEKPEEVTAIKDAQAEIKDEGAESSLPDVTEKSGADQDEKRETEGTKLVEGSSEEDVIEGDKGGEEKETGTIKTDNENIATATVKEELPQSVKVGEVNAEATEKTFDGEKAEEGGVEPVVEEKKEEAPSSGETQKDGNIKERLDEGTVNVSETVKASQDSALEVEEEEESTDTNKENSEQEKVEEVAKSDVQNLVPSSKDAEEAKVLQDLPREAPAKPAHKQSNNILSKVKQSLVKAKKAIIGKSPTPKTVSSDTKREDKVDN